MTARRLMDRPQPAAWQDRPTGAALQPCPFPQVPPAAFRWVGGCNVPGNLGRLNATFPLAVPEVAPGSATLRVRPRAIAAIFGAGKPVVFAPAGDLTAFPVRGLATKGIGLQYASYPAWYFWTGEREMILTVLATAGFNTSLAEMKARLLLGGQSGGQATAPAGQDQHLVCEGVAGGGSRRSPPVTLDGWPRTSSC
jgi:hypothetical protein